MAVQTTSGLIKRLLALAAGKEVEGHSCRCFFQSGRRN
ncbi:hypothetical protein GQ600_4473 [Phytophthora cactorum]|nr:hypothetical protein GQ600_6559 [Phytophthora cactorum]KAF1789120.1 hypothetical protein GQ600_4473 [Phytophthora cactorum]